MLADEVKIKKIPLLGIITNPNQEISGLDWYKDNLFLLPENLNGFVFVISKLELINSIESKNPPPISPKRIAFKTPNYNEIIEGFEGFESIAFNNETFIVTIEASDKGKMISYIAWGEIDKNSLEMEVQGDSIKVIETPTQIKNMTYESALFHKESVMLLYEANGSELQLNITQPKINLKNHLISNIKFPNIEYRITDATSLDNDNKFWAINYFWPGDKKRLKPAKDLIKHKKGSSHSKSEIVERLIEFKVNDNKIVLTDREPIQLELDEKNSRNWEGIARLKNKGFIIATDKYPEMVLAFVEYK